MKKGYSFSSVKNVHPGRSMFNLSYEKIFDGDMGVMYPCMHDDVVPNDIFKIGCQAIVRFPPLVAPILHDVTLKTDYFFVPYRILDDTFEEMLTNLDMGVSSPVIPKWEPTDYAEGSLWDYFGFPAGVDPDGAYPMDYGKRAYNLIYNEYFRDENLIPTPLDIETAEDLQICAWEKDYFTAALPWLQRGSAPALPVSGSAVWPGFEPSDPFNMLGDLTESPRLPYNSDTLSVLNNNTLTTSTFDISDLRLAFQIQKYLERDARGGARYTEWLRAHHGTSPTDDRLDRPEYIGGTRSPIIFSEVLQTSESGSTPQGNLAGHGIGVSDGFVGSYRAEEYGCIIGIMRIVPRPAYHQGINRQWLKDTRFDFFDPLFVNLSEQEVIRAELYADSSSTNNNTVFGYQGRYDEMRYKPNMVCGKLHSSLDHWTIVRNFSSAPILNQTFIECVPRKDYLAAPSDSTFIVRFANLIKAIRPIPVMSEPGMIDH